MHSPVRALSDFDPKNCTVILQRHALLPWQDPIACKPNGPGARCYLCCPRTVEAATPYVFVAPHCRFPLPLALVHFRCIVDLAACPFLAVRRGYVCPGRRDSSSRSCTAEGIGWALPSAIHLLLCSQSIPEGTRVGAGRDVVDCVQSQRPAEFSCAW